MEWKHQLISSRKQQFTREDMVKFMNPTGMNISKSTYLRNNQVTVVQGRAVKFHEDFILADFGNWSIAVGKAIEVLVLAHHAPLLHSSSGCHS